MACLVRRECSENITSVSPFHNYLVFKGLCYRYNYISIYHLYIPNYTSLNASKNLKRVQSLGGAKTYSHLPPHEELSLYHPKTIDKQEQQNEFYEKIFTKNI